MEDDAADQLHIVVTLLERPLRGLADGGDGLRQDIIVRLALGEALAQNRRLAAKLLVGHYRDGGLETIDAVDALLEGSDEAVVGRAANGVGTADKNGRSSR